MVNYNVKVLTPAGVGMEAVIADHFDVDGDNVLYFYTEDENGDNPKEVGMFAPNYWLSVTVVEERESPLVAHQDKPGWEDEPLPFDPSAG